MEYFAKTMRKPDHVTTQNRLSNNIYWLCRFFQPPSPLAEFKFVVVLNLKSFSGTFFNQINPSFDIILKFRPQIFLGNFLSKQLKFQSQQ